MPELPEVETVRRGLEPAMVGARIERVEQRRPDLRFRFPKRFVARLTGQEVVGLGRRAKYLLADLSSGEVLVMHLGMSGRFLVTQGGRTRVPGEFHAEAGGESAHDHVVFHLSNGARITYNDARRFGLMDLVPRAELDSSPHFRDLGLEPLGNELSGEAIARLFRRQAGAAQGGAPRPAPDRRARQHLCQRGAVPGRAASGSAGGLARDGRRQAARAAPIAWRRRSAPC